MTFKEKHLALLLVATSVLTISCKNENSERINEKTEQGLLDPTPVESRDYYGHKEVLYHANIRIYDNKNKAFSNKYILTRAPKIEADWPERGNEETKVIPTRYNDSNTTVLVEVYKKDNVLVDHRGLAVIDGNIEVLDPDNWDKNIQEYDKKQNNYLRSLENSDKNRLPDIMNTENDSLVNITARDSLAVDSVQHDSVAAKTDTARIFTEKQFLDSLQNTHN